VKYPDPHDDLFDEEFEEQFLRLLDKERSVAVSFRFPQSVLDRAKSAAQGLNVPYQTLVKSIVEAGLERLERRPGGAADVRRRLRADSEVTAARANGSGRRRSRAPRDRRHPILSERPRTAAAARPGACKKPPRKLLGFD
jgi:predicted DNA-binding protein